MVVAVIIKYVLCLSYEKTFCQIHPKQTSHISLDDDNSYNPNSPTEELAYKPTHQDKLILDGIEAEQAMRYPIDFSLLNEGSELTVKFIDILSANAMPCSLIVNACLVYGVSFFAF